MATNPLIAALRGASTAPAQASGSKTVNTPWATNTPNVPYTPRFTASTVNRDPVTKKPDDITKPTPGTEGYWEDIIIPSIEGFGGGGTYKNWVPGTRPGGGGSTTPGGGGSTTPGGGGSTTPGGGPTTRLTEAAGWEDMVKQYTDARNQAGYATDAEFMATDDGQKWIKTRDDRIKVLTDPILLSRINSEFTTQKSLPGLTTVGESGLANTIARQAQFRGQI